MTDRRQFVAGVLAASALHAVPALAQAQWPARPIRIVAPLPPGGSYDYLARIIADDFRQTLGQPVVVENRVGADGRLGIEYVARQPADGYTVGIIANTHVVHPALFTKMPYDVLKDLDPVGLIARAPFVLVVHPSVKASGVAEYIALARSTPGKVTFGSSGVGSPFHLAGELMKVMATLDMLHVPYKGSGPVIQALLAGEVNSAFAALGPVLPHIRAGRLRALGIVDFARTGVLPELPTVAEAGPLPGFGLDSWLGLVVPSGTPRAIVERMSDALAKLVRMPDFAEEKLRRQSYDPIGSTPSQMAEVMRADVARYAKLVRDAKIPAE